MPSTPTGHCHTFDRRILERHIASEPVSGAANDRGMQSQHGKGQEMAEGLPKEDSSGNKDDSSLMRFRSESQKYTAVQVHARHAPCPKDTAAGG